ncbi:MAG: hypothetical protein L3J39_06675 [Verrucomicrobiales bacterium]|nr:hypothetical protein [Verrucomicrobiales bacterium]
MGGNSQFAFLLKIAAVLILIWAAVWGVMTLSGVFRETPEKVIAYMESHPLADEQDAGKRKEIIIKLADKLNALDHIQINEFQTDPDKDRRRGFFKEMSAEEQHFFMERRIGKAFNQMMNAFNEMERKDRQRFVEKTLKRMRDDDEERLGLQRLEKSDPQATEKIINEGLKAYYQDATAETKLDLAPLMEQMQRNLRNLRYQQKK